MAAPIMAISDDNKPAVGLWDYHASEHPFHGADVAEAALRELESLRAREIHLTALIQRLTGCAVGLRDHAEVIRLSERRGSSNTARPQP